MDTKRLLTILLVLALCAGTVFGLTYGADNYRKHLAASLSGRGNDPIWRHMTEVDGLIGGGSGQVGSGTIYYVDSAVDGSTGATWATALGTINEGYDKCSANLGDRVYVAEGHSETLGTLALDTEGVTIKGFGQGEDIPEIIYDTTGATDVVAITAASNLIYNISFSAQANIITSGITISDDGDYTSIVNCEFPEPGTSTNEFVAAITLATGADNVTVAGCIYKHADNTGPAEFVKGGDGVVQGLTIIGNRIHGQFSAAPIFSDQTDTEMYIAYNTISNMTGSKYAIDLGDNATGWLVGNKVSTNALATSIDAGKLSVDETTVWSAYGTVDVTAVPIFTNMTGATRWGATELNQIEGEAMDALEAVIATSPTAGSVADIIDRLATKDDSAGATAYPDTVITDSILAYLMSSDRDPAGYDNTDDSLEAIRDRIDTLNTADQGDLDDILEDTGTTLSDAIAAIAVSIAGIDETSYSGRNSAASTTAPVVTLLSGFGNDYFNTGWSMIVTYAAGSAPEGEIRDITDYVSANGAFVIRALTAALADGDKVIVKRTEDLELDVPTTLGSAGVIHYVDSGASAGDNTGETWENAFDTIAEAEAACTVLGGDIVYVADVHNEAIGSLVIDVPNTQFIGMGKGDARPILDFDAAADEITINAAGVVFKNFRLMPGHNDGVVGILLGANGDGVLIENVAFISGESANDEFRDCIVYDTGTVGTTVKNCTYYNTNATAVDQDTFVNLDAAGIDSATIEGCTVFGTFAEAIVWWSAAIPLNLTIRNNTFSNTTASTVCIGTTGAATGVLSGNYLYSSAYGADGITILSPGSLKCFDNWAVDTTDNSAMRIPFSQETSDITSVGDGSNLERLEFLQDKSDDILASRGIDSVTANVFYVDSVLNAGGGGLSWADATDTLAEAIVPATTNTGAFIFIAPDHAEATITASIAISLADITIIGLGTEASRPTFTFSGIGGVMTHSQPDITWENCLFISATADTTVGHTLGATSDGATFINCEWRSTGEFEFVSTVTLASACDDVRFTRCKFNNATSGVAHGTSAITAVAGVVDGLVVEDCEFYGAWLNGAIYSDDDAHTDVIVRNNIVQNSSTGVGAIVFAGAALGTLSDNKCYSDTWGVVIDPGSMKCFNNYVSHELNETGYLFPAQRQKIDSVHGTGRVIYVDSAATAGGGGTWETAFNTIDAAMDDCAHDRGDTIYVAQGHIENEATGADIFTMDINGVSIIGVGNNGIGGVINSGVVEAGEKSQMPLFVLDHADATITMSGMNCRLQGVRIEADIANVAIGITMAADSDGSIVEDCYIADGNATNEMLIGISVAANADYVQLLNNTLTTVTTGGCTHGILLVGGMDFGVIKGNVVSGSYATGCLVGSAAASINLIIRDNIFTTTAVIAAVTLKADTTGVYADNYAASGTTILLSVINDGAMYCFGNFATGAPGTNAVTDPADDSD